MLTQPVRQDIGRGEIEEVAGRDRMICLGALRLLGRGRRQQTPIKLVGNSHSHFTLLCAAFSSVSLLFSIFCISGLLLTDIISYSPREGGVASWQKHSLWAAGIVALMSCPLPWKRLRQRQNWLIDWCWNVIGIETEQRQSRHRAETETEPMPLAID